MLRMGRSPKTEPLTADKPNVNQASSHDASFNRPAGQPSYQSTDVPLSPLAEKPPAPTTASTHAITENEALARDIKDGSMSGFVGRSTVLSGEANFKGMLRIDGHFAGRVHSEKGTLIVSAGGQVDADIEVAAAKINGTVNGDINATERIELGRNAHVNGNIQTPSLVIEQGAIFEGSCLMVQARATQDNKNVAAQSSKNPATAAAPPPNGKPAEEKMVLPPKEPATVGVSEMAG